MPGAGPATPDDLRAVRTFAAALVVRLAAGAAAAYAAGATWPWAAALAGPPLVGLWQAPRPAAVRDDRRLACVDGATAGFWLLVTSGAAGAAAGAAAAAMGLGWMTADVGRALVVVLLLALVPVDYLVMRLGFRIAPDATDPI